MTPNGIHLPDPKNVTYELVGPPHSSGMISFLDANAQPQKANFKDGGILDHESSIEDGELTPSRIVRHTVIAERNMDILGALSMWPHRPEPGSPRVSRPPAKNR